MSVKRRSGGSYQVTIDHGGRTYRKSSRHWTYQDARKVELDWLRQIRDAAAGRKPERALAQAIEKWLTEYVPKLKQPRKTENQIKQLLPFISGRKLNEAPAVWAEIKDKMRRRAPATINHKGRILRHVCNLALREWAWTDEPIGSRIKLLPETPRESFLTVEQIERIASKCSPAAAGYILLAAYTGIRYAQLMRLTHHNVSGQFITLDRSGKTRTLQQVPLHPKVANIAKSLPLHITAWQLRVEWTAVRSSFGLMHVRWHDLRHTCASWLVQAGVPLRTVMEFLGHSSIAVTQRYAHLRPEHLMEAVLKLA